MTKLDHLTTQRNAAPVLVANAESGKQRWQCGAVVDAKILLGKINDLLSQKQIRGNQLCERQLMF